jgi:hypothetical protein
LSLLFIIFLIGSSDFVNLLKVIIMGNYATFDLPSLGGWSCGLRFLIIFLSFDVVLFLIALGRLFFIAILLFGRSGLGGVRTRLALLYWWRLL